MADFNPDQYLAEKTQSFVPIGSGIEAGVSAGMSAGTPFDPDSYLAEKMESPRQASMLGSIAGTAGKLIGKGLDKIDSYAGAPGRKFAGSVTDGKSLGDALIDAKNQFGADTSTAPSAHDLSQKWGLPEINVKTLLSHSQIPGAKLGGLLMNDKSPGNVNLTDLAVGAGTDPTSYLPIGLLSKGVGSAVKGAANVAKDLTYGGKALEDAEAAAKAAKAANADTDTVRATIQSAMPPKTFDEIANHVETAKANGWSTELPAKKEIQRIEQVLPDLEHKILPAQKEAYNDRNSYDVLKSFRELPSPEAKSLIDYEALQKAEGTKKLGEEIKNIGGPPSSDITAAGEKASNAILTRYQQMKDVAGKVFDMFHNVAVDPEEHMTDLTNRIGNSVPSLKPYIKITDGGQGGLEGQAVLAPYNSKMGISQNAYGLIGKVIDDLNAGKASVPEMQSMREFLRNGVDPLSKDSQVIGRVRKAMLDHIQDVIETKAPEFEGIVRPTFKHYAVNEQNLDGMEKVLGGSLNDQASFTKAVKPERVLDRIFSNTNSVKLAKETLGPEFKGTLGDYINSLAQQATDKGGFSSQKFASLLKSNDPSLREAFADNPKSLERLKALADYMRMVPDAVTPNPSGTGKTVFNLNRMVGLLTHPAGAASDVINHVSNKLENNSETRKLVQKVGGMMGQKPEPPKNRARNALNAGRAGLLYERTQQQSNNP